MTKTKTVAIEPSTNTHKMSGVINLKEMSNCTVVTVNPDESIISHGEHGTLKVESANVVVYRQNEYNPVTKGYQKVVD